MKKIYFVALTALSLTACGTSVDTQQEMKTQQLMADADARIGMPKVVNFTEKQLANQIMELRDRPNLATYTYTIDMNGGAHCLGRSIGYGLPYTTQITNPERELFSTLALPQAEPNGLFSSDSTNATWVLLVGTKGPNVTYVETDITVSLEPLRTAKTPC